MSECLPTKDEVCGSDGKTYLNDCALRVEACAKGEDISVVNLGPCGKFMAFFLYNFYILVYYDHLHAFLAVIVIVCFSMDFSGILHTRQKNPGILRSTDLTTT